MRQTAFSAERSVEALLYLCRHLDKPSLHEVLKLRYFADKEYLSRYGHFVSGDDYCAMQYGPVGSATYDLLKAAAGKINQYTPEAFVDAVQDALRVEGARVVPLRPERREYLSEAEIECLDEALSTYANLPFDERTKISHDAAYDKAWADAQRKSAYTSEMDILEVARTLANAEEVIDYLRA